MTPKTMKASVITQPGGPEVLQLAERPMPELKPRTERLLFRPETPPDEIARALNNALREQQQSQGDVLLRVEAAGVNGADLLQRRGKYPVPPGVSAEIPGLEAAGEIVAVSDGVTQWKVGERVTALLTGGGYAEYVTVPAGQCLPWPEFPTGPASPIEAAALPETCCTVWSNVFEIGRLQPGETLLVHGGASGIGTTAIQLAAAKGARVLCTVGSDSKMLTCNNLGAMAIFNYKTDDFVSCVNDVTGGKGVDVILDIVGGSYLQKNLECLAYQGRLVTIATRGGAKAELDIGMMMRKQASITGSLLRPRSVAEKSKLMSAVRQHVWPLLKEAKLRPIIDNTFPLSQADQAHARMESGEHVGKVVLKVI